VPLEPPAGWQELEGVFQRESRSGDFAQAIDFVNRVAEVAEEAHHHPDIADRAPRHAVLPRSATSHTVWASRSSSARTPQ
jgi:pterin-4a-carbinolamine dehydratase